MKDYSAMSDFEINKKVALKLGMDWSGVTEENRFFYQTADYCNNPADAWPIILKHKINIDHRESIKAGAMAKISGCNEVYAVNNNPLRAAMEVYLTAVDAGLLKD